MTRITQDSVSSHSRRSERVGTPRRSNEQASLPDPP